jgi:MFS family permease
MTLLAVHAGLVFLARQTWVPAGMDEARYMLLARALRGFRYVELWQPDAPGHALYPPLYPALLAAWGGVVGDAPSRLVLLGVVLSVACLTAVFLTVRRAWGDLPALGVLAVLAVNPYLVGAAGTVLSETPYTAASVIAIALLTGREVRPARRFAGGAIAIAAALTRGIGIGLVAAVLVVWLLERRWRAALIYAACALVTVGAWHVYSWRAERTVPTGEAYVAAAMTPAAVTPRSRPAELALRLSNNVPKYAVAIPFVLAVPTVTGASADNVAGTVVAAITLALGLVVLWRRGARVAAAYTLVYGAIIVVWPWAFTRFLVPLIPLLLATCLAGLGTAFRRYAGVAAPATVAVLALLFAGGAARTGSLVREHVECRRATDGAWPSAACAGPTRGYFEALRYIATRLPPDARVFGPKPATTYLLTGRYARRYPDHTGDPERLLAGLRREPNAYLLISPLDGGAWARVGGAARRVCEQFALEAAFVQQTYLLRLRASGGEPVGTPAPCVREGRADPAPRPTAPLRRPAAPDGRSGS